MPEDIAKRIEPHDLGRQGADAPLILDVRSPDEYAEGHVQGAVNIPADEVEARLGEIPQDKLVIPCCNMFHPGRSRDERITELLTTRGYQALTLDGGFPAWRDAGLHIEEE